MRILLALSLFSLPVFAGSTGLPIVPDRFTLAGSVRDSATGEILAAANVRILGTSRGTITNAGGEYTLALEPGDYRILFTMLGYRADTASVRVTADTRRDVLLEQSAIVLPEVVVSSEDPAMEIIRRAIANKQRWIDRLRTYEMHAFTRQTIYRDTAIAAINESYTRGYWQAGDTLREIVTQRRQTANVPSAVNFASVGRILNFLDDEIRFFGYTFVGPTAQNALEYYDYKLLRTRSGHGGEIYDIRMLPRTRMAPLFEGTLMIANGTYALVGIDVSPNAAFRIPFVKASKLRYRQQFGLYDATYWMPADIRIEGKFTISIVGLSIPPVAFTQTSVISDYAINTVIPDSIFRKPRLVIDSSATAFDSTTWQANPVLPLSREEERAYRTLDSTQTLDIQFRPGGAAMTLGGDAGGALGAILSYGDVYFNRVEGFHLGAKIDLEDLTPQLSAAAGIAYGFSDRLTSYRLGATLFATPGRIFGAGAEAYRRIDHRPDRGYYSPLFNTFTALLVKNDYRDYHRAEGGRVFVTYRPLPILTADLSYVAEMHDSVAGSTDFSIFKRSLSYRANPAAVSGRLRSLKLDARLGRAPVPLDIVFENSLEVSIEHSSPSFTGGDFDFTRYDAIASLGIPTFGQSFMLRPGFHLRVSAGTSTGSLPLQRWFDIESASSGVAPFGVMRAMDVKEFSGTRYAAFNLEHNFRTLPFLALGIPFLEASDLDLIVHGGAARTWTRGAATDSDPGWYYEAGFGVSRIFDLLRADLTWRLSGPQALRFTLGVAGLL